MKPCELLFGFTGVSHEGWPPRERRHIRRHKAGSPCWKLNLYTLAQRII